MAIQDIQNNLNNLTNRIQSEGITDNNGNQILSPTLAADSLNNAYKAIGLPPPPVPANVPPVTPVSNTGNSTMSDLFKTYLGESTPPPSMESQYNKDYTNIGIDEKQQKVNDLTAQINDIAAQQQAQELQMKNEGISADAIHGRNLDLERQNAIRVLPLKAQLDAAQGNLTAAQDKLNTLFKIQSQDAQNQYNYWKDLKDKAYEFMTAEEKAKADAKEKEVDRQHDIDMENIKQQHAIELKKLDTSSGIYNNSETSGIVNTILGSGKFTVAQSKAITNAINSGEDPLTVVKNQAKNIMGQTEATTVTKFEAAKDAMSSLQSSLQKYYDAGGKTNLFNGSMEKVINRLGEVKDPKLVELATEIQAGLQIYRNAVSGTAYSEQEGKDISSIFPGINKTEGLNTAIINGRMKTFDSAIDGPYRATLGSAYDVLKNKNTPLPTPKPAIVPNDQAQSILDEISGNTSSNKKTGFWGSIFNFFK